MIHTLGRTAGINYLIDPRVRGRGERAHAGGRPQGRRAGPALRHPPGQRRDRDQGGGDVPHRPDGRGEDGTAPPDVPRPTTPRRRLPTRWSCARFPLQYIGVAEMAKVIKPFLSAGGEAVEVARANILLVTDTVGESRKDGAPGGTVRLRGVPGVGDEALQAEGPRPGGDGEEPRQHLRGPRLLRHAGRKAGGHQLRPDPAPVLPAGGQRVAQDHGGRGEVDR